jgi:hypothetical protein
MRREGLNFDTDPEACELFTRYLAHFRTTMGFRELIGISVCKILYFSIRV